MSGDPSTWYLIGLGSGFMLCLLTIYVIYHGSAR